MLHEEGRRYRRPSFIVEMNFTTFRVDSFEK